MSTAAPTSSPDTPEFDHLETPHQETLVMLQQIMSLKPQQRQALRRAWSALEGFAETESPASSPPVAEAQQATQPSEEEIDEQIFSDWLHTTRRLDPRSQLSTYQNALEEEERLGYRQVIETELANVKNTHRLLAMEAALFQYVYENPFMATLAVFATGFGGYQLVKGIWNLIF